MRGLFQHHAVIPLPVAIVNSSSKFFLLMRTQMSNNVDLKMQKRLVFSRKNSLNSDGFESQYVVRNTLLFGWEKRCSPVIRAKEV